MSSSSMSSSSFSSLSASSSSSSTAFPGVDGNSRTFAQSSNSSSTNDTDYRPCRIISWNIGSRALKRTIECIDEGETGFFPNRGRTNVATTSSGSSTTTTATSSASSSVSAYSSTMSQPKTKKRSTLTDLIGLLQADILCFQEVKLPLKELNEDIAVAEGYTSFFAFNSSQNHHYSGVATIVNNNIPNVRVIGVYDGLTGIRDQDKGVPPPATLYPALNEGWEPQASSFESSSSSLTFSSSSSSSVSTFTASEMDNEGRCLITDHDLFVLFNVYAPNATESRINYKLAFHNLLQRRVHEYLRQGRYVIVVGDLNVSHTELDIWNMDEWRRNHPGLEFSKSYFRIWMNSMLQGYTNTTTMNYGIFTPEDNLPSLRTVQMIDTFRTFFPTRRGAFTCWDVRTGARVNNKGNRLDYVLVDNKFIIRPSAAPTLAATPLSSPSVPGKVPMYVDEADIMQDFHGSDHCPVYINLQILISANGTVKYTGSTYELSMNAYFKKQPKLPSSFFRIPKNGSSENCTPSGAESESNSSTDKFSERMPTVKDSSSSSSSSNNNGVKYTNNHNNVTNTFMSSFLASNNNTSSNNNNGSTTSKPATSGVTSKRTLSSSNTNVKGKKTKSSSSSTSLSSGNATLSTMWSTFPSKSSTNSNTVIIIDDDEDTHTNNNTHEVSDETSISVSVVETNVRYVSVQTEQTIIPVSSGNNVTLPTAETKNSDDKDANIETFNALLSGLPPPLCFHNLPTVERRSKKAVSIGQRFYCCALPEGEKNDPKARCEFFLWAKDHSKNARKKK